VLLHRTPALVRYHLMWRSSSEMTPMGIGTGRVLPPLHL
jgi:hypothetical protein